MCQININFTHSYTFYVININNIIRVMYALKLYMFDHVQELFKY